MELLLGKFHGLEQPSPVGQTAGGAFSFAGIWPGPANFSIGVVQVADSIVSWIGAITGSVSFCWQVWAYMSDRPRFSAERIMSGVSYHAYGEHGDLLKAAPDVATTMMLWIEVKLSNRGRRPTSLASAHVELKSGKQERQLPIILNSVVDVPAGLTVPWQWSGNFIIEPGEQAAAFVLNTTHGATVRLDLPANDRGQ